MQNNALATVPYQNFKRLSNTPINYLYSLCVCEIQAYYKVRKGKGIPVCPSSCVLNAYRRLQATSRDPQIWHQMKAE